MWYRCAVSQLAGPVVWIVDDSATQAAFTERSLGSNYRCERFSDGASAIERLATVAELPDVVLLDWVMPGMSGDDVCRYLRNNPPTRELPIVILTASRTSTDDVVFALESGANDYVAKPFVAEELRARVGAILRTSNLKRAAEREQARVSAMNDLSSALFHAGNDLDALLGAIAAWLISTVADGCALSLFLDQLPTHTTVRHRNSSIQGCMKAPPLEAASLPPQLVSADEAVRAAPGLVDYVTRCGLDNIAVRSFRVRDLGTAVVLLTRDGPSQPFDSRDATTLATCLEYSALALEAAARSAKERATTRFLEEMLGIVGHDLRSPLAAMELGFTLLRENATEQGVRVLGRVERSAQRMSKIVEQLLDVTLSRIGTGIPLTPKPVQLHAIINPILDELRMVHPETTFLLTGDDVGGVWDSDRIEQVVSNLANNATVYGRKNAPIRLEISQIGGGAQLVVHNELRDRPIAPEVLDALFDPFERGRDTSNAKGIGLGLYIVSEIVRAHGGTITVDSDESGTRFCVVLPLATAEASASARQ